VAIEKIKTRKFELSLATGIQLGVAAAFAVTACILGYFAFAKWRFKVALVTAYEAYDSGQLGVAKPELQSALSWRPDHAGARELLAKIRCEGGEFPEAQRDYERLRSQGYNPPQVRVGMGVVLLRSAERAEGKDAVTLAEMARKEFESARGFAPEADVGIGHVELLLAHKAGDPARLNRARDIFTKIKTALDTKPDYARAYTREGLLDFYSGLGKVLASGETYDAGAGPALRASYQYSRRWVRPLATLLVVEAKRFAQMKDMTNDALLKMEGEVTVFRNEMGNFWKSNRDAQALMKEPWLMHGLAVATAFARVGNHDKYTLMFNEVANASGENIIIPLVLDAAVRTEVAIRDNPNASVQDKFVGHAMSSYSKLVDKLTLSDDLSKERRARALNGLAWMEAWRGGLLNNQGMHARALDHVSEAAKLFPDEYVYNRNVLTLLKRLNRPANAYQPYLEKAKAGGTGDWADDFEKLQKYLGVP
jgi:tetratricopeptide (TPR) repeat protein